jgi:hypothetical protein
MGKDRNEPVKSPELHPDIKGPEAASTSTSTSSQRPGTAYSAPQPPGAFYSPPPGMETTSTASKAPWRMAALGVAAAVGVVAIAWRLLTPSPPDAPLATAALKDQKHFAVSKVDADLKATQYLKDLLEGKATGDAGGDPLHAVNAAALKNLAQTSPETADAIKSGKCVLYRLYLLDFLAEDGDRAELSVDGLGFGDIYLKNAGTEFLIPLVANKPAQMKLTATGDAGGGVTVGFVSSMGEARTRTMQVGDYEQWQVTVQ